MNATITNIISEGENIRVFADFSNGENRSYVFTLGESTGANIKAVIQVDVDELKKIEEKRKADEVQARKVATLLENLKGDVIK